MPDDEERPPGFWRRNWWIYPVLFGVPGAYQLVTGADDGRWGDPAIGVPLCLGLAVLGGWLARSGWFDRMSR